MEKTLVIGLVCGMEVEEKAAKFTSEFHGVTYYFCAPGCKFMFKEEAEAYVGPDRKPFVNMDEVPNK